MESSYEYCQKNNIWYCEYYIDGQLTLIYKKNNVEITPEIRKELLANAYPIVSIRQISNKYVVYDISQDYEANPIVEPRKFTLQELLNYFKIIHTYNHMGGFYGGHSLYLLGHNGIYKKRLYLKADFSKSFEEIKYDIDGEILQKAPNFKF